MDGLLHTTCFHCTRGSYHGTPQIKPTHILPKPKDYRAHMPRVIGLFKDDYIWLIVSKYFHAQDIINIHINIFGVICQSNMFLFYQSRTTADWQEWLLQDCRMRLRCGLPLKAAFLARSTSIYRGTPHPHLVLFHIASLVSFLSLIFFWSPLNKLDLQILT